MMKKDYYSPKEVADMLALSTSSVRKYCAELELAGKSFLKTESGARQFDEDDLQTLKAMKYLLGKGAKYAEAAEQARRGVKVPDEVILRQDPLAPVADDGLNAVMGDLLREVRQLREENVAIRKSLVTLEIAEIDRQHAEALRLNAPEAAPNEEVEKVAAKPTMEFAKVASTRKPGLLDRLFGRK